MSKVEKVRLERSTEEGADRDYAALEKAPGIESRVDVDLEQDPLAAWEDQFLPYQLGPRPVFPTLVNNCSEIPFQQEGWVFSERFRIFMSSIRRWRSLLMASSFDSESAGLANSPLQTKKVRLRTPVDSRTQPQQG